jgi:hypothetical protein
MSDAAMVFRGLVIERKVLPSRDDMRGRGRYSIVFRVNEYWKGSSERTVLLYDVDPSSDCLGFGYQVGKEYLVYAREQKVDDIFVGDALWVGWKDILPEGSDMLVDIACTPTGEISTVFVRAALAELGRGRKYPKVRQR